MVNIRDKGSKAELEWIKRFQIFFDNTLERNLLQTREGGSDVTGCHPWVVEIKRVEDCSRGNKNSWWKQVLSACPPEGGIPTVAFRPSRTAWRFLLPATYAGLDMPSEYLEVSEEVWLALVLEARSGRP